MSSKTKLLEQQRQWATSVGADIDTRGYLSSVAENLYQPLSSRAFRDFSQGSGSELADTVRRPAKMKALHSSAALAVNVFDYWTDRNMDPIFAALEIDPSAKSVAFEAQFSTGLEGNPPNLDLGIRYRSGLVIGVESKFTEWLTPKAPRKVLFKPKYFPESTELWSSRGLAACQTLARKCMRELRDSAISMPRNCSSTRWVWPRNIQATLSSTTSISIGPVQNRRRTDQKSNGSKTVFAKTYAFT